MNKIIKTIGLITALAGAIMAGGCGEKAKTNAEAYQALKAEVTPLVEKNRDIYHPWREGVAKLTKDLDVFMQEKQEAQQKLDEMEKYAHDDKTLTEDYLPFRADAEQVFAVGEQDLKNFIKWAEKDGYK